MQRLSSRPLLLSPLLVLCLLSCLLPHSAALLLLPSPLQLPIHARLLIPHLTALFGTAQPYNVSLPVAPYPQSDPSLLSLCSTPPPVSSPSLFVSLRGNCSFYAKAVSAQAAGGGGLVVVGYAEDEGEDSELWIRMQPGDEDDAAAIRIPVVFVLWSQYQQHILPLWAGTGPTQALARAPLIAQLSLEGEMGETTDAEAAGGGAPRLSFLLLLAFPVQAVLLIVVLLFRRKWKRDSDALTAQRRQTLIATLPTIAYSPQHSASALPAASAACTSCPAPCINSSCSVCLDDFSAGHALLLLPCRHAFCPPCIGEWLLHCSSPSCPVCKQPLEEQQAGTEERPPRLGCGCCLARPFLPPSQRLQVDVDDDGEAAGYWPLEDATLAVRVVH